MHRTPRDVRSCDLALIRGCVDSGLDNYTGQPPLRFRLLFLRRKGSGPGDLFAFSSSPQPPSVETSCPPYARGCHPVVVAVTEGPRRLRPPFEFHRGVLHLGMLHASSS